MSNTIEIRKYEYQANRAKNYFASPTFIDGITLTRIMIDGFPIFNEEFANQFDSFELKASDYDLVFSRLEDTLTTNGDTLETFLSTNLNNHCLACKVTMGDKTFGGLIDVNSITFIDTLDSDGYKIKVTIYGFEKELSLAAQASPNIQPAIDINFFIVQLLSKCIDGFAISPIYLQFNNSNLLFEPRVGYNPVIIHELFNYLVDDDRMLNVTNWKLFEDLCKAFGIIYKVDVTGISNDYLNIVVSLAFRDTGFSSDTISVNWLNRERGFISDINANVIQCFKFQKEQNLNIYGEIIPNNFYGTVFNKDEITTADGDVYGIAGGYGEEKLFSNGDGLTINKLANPFPFDVADKVNFVEMNYYFDSSYFNGYSTNVSNYVIGNSDEGWYSSPQVRMPKRISFPRMFTKAGYEIVTLYIPGRYNITYIKHVGNIHTLWYDLIENTCGSCYNYLLQTFKKYTSGKISLLDGFDVNVFDKITVNEETYTIYKVSNLNFNERTCDIYAIQD